MFEECFDAADSPDVQIVTRAQYILTLAGQMFKFEDCVMTGVWIISVIERILQRPTLTLELLEWAR